MIDFLNSDGSSIVQDLEYKLSAEIVKIPNRIIIDYSPTLIPKRADTFIQFLQDIGFY